MTPERIQIWTDGSCLGNPGPGGWGAILVHGTNRKELKCGYGHTTNIRMELMAVIHALEAIKKPELGIDVYTDSQYVTEAINRQWIYKWQRTLFAGRKNADLWLRFWPLLASHKPVFHWVKGHNGTLFNECADVLAKSAAQDPTETDYAYLEAQLEKM